MDDGHGSTGTQTLTVTVDQAPTLTSDQAATDTTANLTAAHTVDFTLSTGKDVNVTAGTTITLSDGSTATYVSGTGTQTLVFEETGVTTAPPANASTLKVTGIGSGSATDTAGNALSIPGGGLALTNYTVDVADTAANISAHFDSLNAIVADISDVHITSGTELDLTASQALNDTALIALIEPTGYDLVVKDTAANVQANIDALQGDVANISSIALTDGGSPLITINNTQQTNDAGILAKIDGPFDLKVTGLHGSAPNLDSTAAAPTYNAIEQVYDATHTLTETIYFNIDGTQTVMFAPGANVTFDDSASTHSDFFDLSQAATRQYDRRIGQRHLRLRTELRSHHRPVQRRRFRHQQPAGPRRQLRPHHAGRQHHHQHPGDRASGRAQLQPDHRGQQCRGKRPVADRCGARSTPPA